MIKKIPFMLRFSKHSYIFFQQSPKGVERLTR
jgi:hypothetical protein